MNTILSKKAIHCFLCTKLKMMVSQAMELMAHYGWLGRELQPRHMGQWFRDGIRTLKMVLNLPIPIISSKIAYISKKGDCLDGNLSKSGEQQFFVGNNYNLQTKKYQCVIEQYQKEAEF